MILYSTIVGSTVSGSAVPPPDQAASVGLTPVPSVSLTSSTVQDGFVELQQEINANDVDIITLDNSAALAVAKFHNALI